MKANGIMISHMEKEFKSLPKQHMRGNSITEISMGQENTLLKKEMMKVATLDNSLMEFLMEKELLKIKNLNMRVILKKGRKMDLECGKTSSQKKSMKVIF